LKREAPSLARLVYACRFEVPSTSGVGSAVTAYREWIERHYRERRGLRLFDYDLSTNGISTTVPAGHLLKSNHTATDLGQAVVIEWAYPADNDDTLRWRNDIRIGGFDGRCSVEHLIWIESIDYQVSPAQFALGSPSVIRRLCSDQSVLVGEMQIRAAPYPLKNDGVPDFLALLRSQLRKLPIVFLAPHAGGDPNQIDATAMAQRLAGVAIVVEVQDVDATWDIGEALGRSLSCFNGGVRIYWPGFKDTDDPRRHPLYLGARVEALGPDVIARTLERTVFAVASFRFVPDARITEIIRKAEQAQRAGQLEAQRASTGVDWEAYAVEIDGELSAAKQRLTELEAENENLRANQQVFFASRASDEMEEVSPEEIAVPASVQEAVEVAKRKCSHLIILDSALSSASSSPFQRPADIVEALQDLDQVAVTWTKLKAERGNGGDLRQHLTDQGWGKRCSMHISDTTRSRYKADYTFSYGSNSRLFEPHITLGSGDPNSCASIHFIMDETKGKIVVAHVGRHLPNTKS
jgi:hypothetical protein